MKLGLITMSGVRAHNPALTRLGLTLPGFVERNRVVAALPSLALLTLAGVTPRDVDLHYAEVPNLDAIDHVPGEFDAVAIASYTAQINDAYRLADRYRALGTKVILGGLHVSALPDEARQHADSLVLGEAEGVWPGVVDDLRRGSLQPIYDARRTSFDLRHAPMPRFDLLDVDHYNRITVQTQRGCPFSCEFCASSIRLTPNFKVKPVEKVIAEIRQIKRSWDRPFIEFADDNTFANKAHGKRLMRALAREDVRWFTETDVSVADDAELLALLRDAGCAQLLIGLEAPDRRGLEHIEAKANWKAERADRYAEAVRRIQEHGITVNGCFILGLDGQDADSFDNVVRFVRESGLYEVQVTLQTPFPGTPLRQRLLAAGRLLDEHAWEKHTLFDVTFRPQAMTASELERRFHGLVRTLYAAESTNRRRRAFRRAVRDRAAAAPGAGEAVVPA
jgi:radical SAM superfamily enzyme YgiQ (UPF0313 family)